MNAFHLTVRLNGPSTLKCTLRLFVDGIKPLHKPASGNEFGSIYLSKGCNIDEIFT